LDVIQSLDKMCMTFRRLVLPPFSATQNGSFSEDGDSQADEKLGTRQIEGKNK